MELSGIELRYIVNQISDRVSQGYYVSSVSSVTSTSLLLRLHHPTKEDVMLVVSTKGIWITQLKFKTIEENILENIARQEIERAKFESIEQAGSERIVYLKFRQLDGGLRNLVAEFFGEGNLMVCDDSMQIMAIMYPVEVRHRTLRVGLRYAFPPSRGVDVFNLTLDQLAALRGDAKDLDVRRWIGRSVSLPKKFVEEVVRRAGIDFARKAGELSENEVARIYDAVKNVATDVSTGSNHRPVILLQQSKSVEALPIITDEAKKMDLKESSTFMEAIDEVLGSEILQVGRSSKTVELDRQIAVLEHDLAEQNKAKQEVMDKAAKIRRLASDLMKLSYDSSQKIESVLESNSSSIEREKGIKYIQVAGEKVELQNFATTSSLLFERAKEMERGNASIDEASARLLEQIEKLRGKTDAIHKKVIVQKQISKEWYERYRWFITTDGLMAVGGRDSSSNSALVRKHLTENDIVFHAEVHGSPFFIVKNAAQGASEATIEESLRQVAQATVSFSRAWKDGISSADAYWVMPGQIKRGAPTGQFLPKGSFVIEGKRNYLKGIDVRLAIGIMEIDGRETLVCGPEAAIKPKSLCYAVLLQGGMDPMAAAKKTKAELVAAARDSEFANSIKRISLDDFVRVLPNGQSRVSFAAPGGQVNKKSN